MTMPGVVDDRAVGDRARYHDLHLHPAPDRFLQQRHRVGVGDEVRILYQQLLLGGGTNINSRSDTPPRGAPAMR